VKERRPPQAGLSAEGRTTFSDRIAHNPGHTRHDEQLSFALVTFAAESAQHAPVGQQAESGQQIGQQPPSGQHDSLATGVMAALAQHAPSGQQALSGQQEASVAGSGEPIDSAKAATVPVTSNAKAITLLAMIFVSMIILQSFVCRNRRTMSVQSTRFARGPEQLARCLAHNSLKENGISAGAQELTQPNAMGDVDRAARQRSRHNGRHMVDSADSFDDRSRKCCTADEIYLDFFDGCGRTFKSHPLGTRTAIDWGW
jgi:hypothetical protein